MNKLLNEAKCFKMLYRLDFEGWSENVVLVRAELFTIHDGEMKARTQCDPRERLPLISSCSACAQVSLQYSLSGLTRKDKKSE